jgi:hypothetical protein
MAVSGAAAGAPGKAARLFDGRLLAALIAAGLLSFIGFFVLSAYAPDFSSGRDGRAHSLSTSAVGYKGLVDLIHLTGGEAWTSRNEDALESEELLVLTPQRGGDADALEELLNIRGSRTTLLILPKWDTAPHPVRRSWVVAAGTIHPMVIDELLPGMLGDVNVDELDQPAKALQGRDFLGGMTIQPAGVTRFLTGKAIEPLLVAPTGQPVLARLKNRSTLYILADPDLLNNAALRRPEQAQAALSLIEALSTTDAEGVTFDLTLTGHGKGPSLLKLAFEPPFLAFTIAAGVFALLAALHGLGRFGPAAAEQRAISLGKAALVDNSAGLLRLAKREHMAGDGYAELMRDMAARDLGAPANLGGDALDGYLDRVGGPDRHRFSDLSARLRDAGDRHALLRAAQALFSWKKDLSQ